MQQRNVGELLRDVLHYGALARRYAEGSSILSFSESSERYGAERCLQIVGEAVTRLIAVEPETVWHISDTSRIVAFRHLLTHHYYRVSPAFLVQIVRGSLPLLEEEAANLLARCSYIEETPNDDT